MRFGWCMACGKKERSVNAFEEIYGRGLAWLSVVIVAGLIGGLISPESKAEVLGGLDQRLNPDLLAQVFPGAQSFGAVGGKPAAAPVFQEGAPRALRTSSAGMPLPPALSCAMCRPGPS